MDTISEDAHGKTFHLQSEHRMPHLSNCHGEWTAVAVILANIPLLLAWVKTCLRRNGDLKGQ